MGAARLRAETKNTVPEDCGRRNKEPRSAIRGGARRAGIAALGLLALTGAAAADGIPTRTLSCAQAAALVRQKGAVLLATSPTLYDRYVNDRRFCMYDQELKPEWVPTRDVAQCFVGYICYEPSRNGGNRG